MALPPGVEVVAAMPDQEPVVANLLQLYAYDLSDVVDVPLRPDGRYDYPYLPLYWQESTRFPFLVTIGGQLSGFALVSRGSLVSGDPDVWDMAEFFIMRRYRRLGVGTAVAHEIWRRFPGPWDVRVLTTNRGALVFWQAAVNSFVGSTVTPIAVDQGGRRRQLFWFQSPGEAAAS